MTWFRLAEKMCYSRKVHMDFGSPKIYLIWTAQASPPPVSHLVRGYFTESKNAQRGFHHKVVFLAPAVYYKKKRRESWKCLLCLLFSVSLVLQGMSLHLAFGLFCRTLKRQHDLNEKCPPFTCPEKTISDEEVCYTCLFHPSGQPEKTFITSLLCR